MAAEVKLSKRLTAIAEMVNAAGPGERKNKTGYCLCDVGTDHAHIPIRLLMDGVIDRAIAMDVIEGPLEKARGNIELYGVCDKVILRISDGLDSYRPGEAQGLVIAGMGGRIMSRILLREPDKSLDFDEIILQPQADPEFVRRAVRELGLFIDRERIVLEDNKYYPVMHVSHNRCDVLWQKGVNDRIMHSLQKANKAKAEAVKEKTEEVAQKDRLIRTALEYFEIMG